VTAQRWTLSFVDPALERAYIEAVARANRVPWRIVAVAAAMITVGASFTDRAVHHTDGNVDVARAFRFGLVFPVAALGLVFGWLPERVFARRYQAVIGVLFATVLAANFGSALFLPDPEALDIRTPLLSVVLVTASFCSIVGMRSVWAQPIALLGNVGIAVAILVRWPPSDALGPAIFWQITGAVIASLASYLIERRDRFAFLATRLLAEERARSERLLLNVLPQPIADQLKDGAARIADHFDQATVLFADIVGFTALTEELPAADVVTALDDIFSTFDDLAERLGLEKIKTIGDAYMVVGGVPTPRTDHATAVAQMALAMQRAVEGRRLGRGALSIRIGIHSGPVVAGVIGKRKFLYDLWGDTVNTASRLEAHGLPGEIQVSAATRALLEGRFELVPRGTIPLKGKGEVETWLLRAVRGGP